MSEPKWHCLLFPIVWSLRFTPYGCALPVPHLHPDGLVTVPSTFIRVSPLYLQKILPPFPRCLWCDEDGVWYEERTKTITAEVCFLETTRRRVRRTSFHKIDQSGKKVGGDALETVVDFTARPHTTIISVESEWEESGKRTD